MTTPLTALELFLETLAIQALVLSVLFFARRKSAATQHLYLSAAVLTVLALTGISPFVPSRQLGVIPIQGSVAEPEHPAAPRAIGGAEVSPEGVGEAGPSAMPSERRDQPGSGRDWPATLASIWVLGSAVLFFWMLLGLVYSWWLSRRARPPDSLQLEDRFRWALEKVGLRPGVALVESESLRIPVVFGFIRPRVILPARANRWSEDRLRAVLLHESAHIQRKDLVFQFLAKLTCALYWFNPLTWIIERRLFLAGERAADDQVIRQEFSPADYAEHLMETSVELGTERSPIWATAAMAEGTAFKDRILSILDPNIRRGEPNVSNQAAVTLSALALAMSLIAFSPWSGASAPSVQTLSPTETVPTREAAPVDQGATPQGLSGDLETLLRMLRMEDPSMREHAATALGQLGDERARLPLIEVMQTDADPRVREHAASALGRLGDRRSYDILLQTMHGSDAVRVRAHAAYALGLLGDARALDVLLAALEDESAVMRMNAAAALGELGDPGAVDMLRRAQNDPDANVRSNAGEALRKIRGR